MKAIKKDEYILGIIEGGGTGSELAEIFQEMTGFLFRKKTGGNLNYFSFRDRFGYQPHTFWGLSDACHDKDYSCVKRICAQEVEDIIKFYTILQHQNGLGVFRTAINAETLYYVRQKAKILKAVPLILEKSGNFVDLHLIRDQIQGYYSNQSLIVRNGRIKIVAEFSAKNFGLIINFVKEQIKKCPGAELLFIYKFHIMGVELQRMIDAAMKFSGLDIDYKIFQPDSGLHYLLHDMFRLKKKEKKIYCICANEVGDTLLETLVHYFHLGSKETFFTANYVIGHGNIEELQTMHGSADAIARKHIVNPIATLKLSAYAAEKWLGISGAVKKMEKALQNAAQAKYMTPDMGGRKKTDEVVSFVMANWG